MICRPTWLALPAAALLPLLLATAGHAAAPTAGAEAHSPAGAATDTSATDGHLIDTGTRLAALADPAEALAVFYDPAGGGFVVLLPADSASDRPGTAALRDSLRSTRPDRPIHPVRVEVSSFSTGQLEAFTTHLSGRDFHPAAAQYSYGSYLDPATDRLILATDAPPAVVAPLLARFDGAVAVRHGEASARLRRDDFAPFWGGASITNGGGVCSSGFPVQSGGLRFMVTAGHCFGSGDTVTSTGNGNLWGSFTPHAALPDPDLAIISGGSYQGAIYVGGIASGSGAAVASFGDPVVGFTDYCFSGQTSGEVCGHTAVSLTGVLCDPLGCTADLVVSDGQRALPGDSGSPWYAMSAGGQYPVHIRGLTVGVVAGQSYWHRYGTVAATGVTGVVYP